MGWDKTGWGGSVLGGAGWEGVEWVQNLFELGPVGLLSAGLVAG